MFMAEASRERTRSEIILKGRSEMSVCGVEEVINFDEDGARLKTVGGELCVEGSGIKIGALDTDRGVVSLSGKIDGAYYVGDAAKQKRGLFSRRAK